MLADFAYLATEVLLDHLAPNAPALAILVGAVLEASKLFPPFSNERIQPQELGFEFGGLTVCALHCRKLDPIIKPGLWLVIKRTRFYGGKRGVIGAPSLLQRRR